MEKDVQSKAGSYTWARFFQWYVSCGPPKNSEQGFYQNRPGRLSYTYPLFDCPSLGLLTFEEIHKHQNKKLSNIILIVHIAQTNLIW